MKWFGNWTAPITECSEKTGIPTIPCGHCHQAFTTDDIGVVMPFLGDPPEEIAYHHHCLGELLGIDPC